MKGKRVAKRGMMWSALGLVVVLSLAWFNWDSWFVVNPGRNYVMVEEVFVGPVRIVIYVDVMGLSDVMEENEWKQVCFINKRPFG